MAAAPKLPASWFQAPTRVTWVAHVCIKKIMAVEAQCSARMLVTEVIKILQGFVQKFAHLRANILFLGWGSAIR